MKRGVVILALVLLSGCSAAESADVPSTTTSTTVSQDVIDSHVAERCDESIWHASTNIRDAIWFLKNKKFSTKVNHRILYELEQADADLEDATHFCLALVP